MSLVLVLNQHASDFANLLLAESEPDAWIDKVAYHLLTLSLIGETFDKFQAEALR